MSKIVYGIFNDRAHAETALDRIDRRGGGHGTHAILHEGHIADQEIPIGATYAIRWAIYGGLFAGLGGAIISALVLAPNAAVTFGLFEFMSVVFAGTIFGVIGGAVSGASEARTSLRPAHHAVESGQVLMTVDCDYGDKGVKVIAEELAANGATEARAA